ncbi:MAG: ATP phosphoribosyltransferase regulatory subunit [Nitrosomonadales bacterium]|jgi:ATP phosphoribosyltransferase regulatory subunit|nr:ATP phosphoribosyltransferase regulatory subunit [Nitrosomonadales bacterium]MBT4183452.1 ATP phosphoribosyltransferase regulatory subunit [Nitrosomonadales bacterium]MBT4570690.1 ATP phosphoribosyltransferase regulatory subunit [Nitrosomonadales bacterium]MBT7407415.1 ATP phosphoribosyltransferase regulatory subunit [Nitrosomonadales bacterium]
MNQWLLPENTEDIFPEKAVVIETKKRLLLDLYLKNGYQLIFPSMLEFSDSLNAYGRDLDLETYKVVDQMTGKMMGVSSDLTTQAFRIDSQMKEKGINKLCYAGTVLRANPSNKQPRELLQVGAEYFGDASIDADLEIQKLLIESLKALDIKDIVLDINHLDVYNSLKNEISLSPNESLKLGDAMMLKDKGEIEKILSEVNNSKITNKLISLTDLYGDESILEDLKKVLPDQAVAKNVTESLTCICESLKKMNVEISFDFSDIRGYQYHTGIVYSAYAQKFNTSVAQGGRYDNMNKSIADIRPATGFSIDLRFIINNLLT